MSTGAESQTCRLPEWSVTLGDHEITVHEIDWMQGLKSVGLIVDLFGGVKGLSDALERRGDFNVVMILEIIMSPIAKPKTIAELMALFTDKNAKWFLTPGRLSQRDFLKLAKEALGTVPFDSLSELWDGLKGRLTALREGDSGRSQESSDESAAGSPGTLPDSESSGRKVSVASAVSELETDSPH